jgi:hypothetical protein
MSSDNNHDSALSAAEAKIKKLENQQRYLFIALLILFALFVIMLLSAAIQNSSPAQPDTLSDFWITRGTAYVLATDDGGRFPLIDYELTVVARLKLTATPNE